jgi:hypothetical protein
VNGRQQLWLVIALRSCLFIVGAVAIVAGAWIPLPPLLATALWVVAMLVLVCLPLSPVSRAVARGLRIPKHPPQSLVRSGTSLMRDDCRPLG